MLEPRWSTDVKPIACSKCGKTNVQVVEDVRRFYPAGMHKGKLVALPSWPPDIDDEGENHRLYCPDCQHEEPLPKPEDCDYTFWWEGE